MKKKVFVCFKLSHLVHLNFFFYKICKNKLTFPGGSPKIMSLQMTNGPNVRLFIFIKPPFASVTRKLTSLGREYKSASYLQKRYLRRMMVKG